MDNRRILPDQHIDFLCNICNCANSAYIKDLKREEPSCRQCGSTVRMRSVVKVLIKELFGRDFCINEIHPPRPDLVGVGLTCWDGYAIPLAHKIAFRNTYYHKEPHLDIMNIDPSMEGTLDFMVSTDVFEHVAPPVSNAFANARKLLKPNGVFVITVPYTDPSNKLVETKEWFPDLYSYKILNIDGAYVLVNITKEGVEQEFRNLCFHGGPGDTLEMRVFSEASLIKELFSAGFNELTFYSKPDLKYGIYWPQNQSLPVAARTRKHFPWKVKTRVIKYC